uniref:Uncharacterized protein n=1 Tax=Piliocolobus tephrosceles TaxID=591936 RepID=A0A8C9LWW1_9PRIM
MGFHHVGQADLVLLTSGDPSALASQSAGIIGVSHRTQPGVAFYEERGPVKSVPYGGVRQRLQLSPPPPDSPQNTSPRHFHSTVHNSWAKKEFFLLHFLHFLTTTLDTPGCRPSPPVHPQNAVAVGRLLPGALPGVWAGPLAGTECCWVPGGGRGVSVDGSQDGAPMGPTPMLQGLQVLPPGRPAKRYPLPRPLSCTDADSLPCCRPSPPLCLPFGGRPRRPPLGRQRAPSDS